MNALIRFSRLGLLLLAAAILGGCANIPPPVVPERGYGYTPGYTSGYGRGYDLYHPRANTLESTMVTVELPGGRTYFYQSVEVVPRQYRDYIVSVPRHGLTGHGYRGASDVGLERPMYLADDLDAMAREVEIQLLARCKGDGRATDTASQTAGTAAGGAIVGAIVNGAPGALAGAAVGALAGASRAADYGRYNCQALINERDFIRRQRFLLEQWKQDQARRDRAEELRRR